MSETRYEIIDKAGIPITLKSGGHGTFATAVQAVEYARYLWPDQSQDEERSGKGWDIQVVGADR